MKKLILIILILCSTTLGQFQQKPMLGEQIDWAHPLPKGLVGWLLNEGSGNKVFDLSGGNTGTLVADTHWVPGKFGSALDFDGTGDYIDLGTPSNLMSLVAPLTYSLWVKFDSFTNGPCLISFDVTNANTQFAFGVYTAQDEIVVGTSNTELGLSGVSNYLVVNQWYHWVVIYHNTPLQEFYLNGIKQTLSSLANNHHFSAKQLNIGSREDGTERALDGQIDHVLIYDRVLSASEIALLYREPFCMFKRDDVAIMAKAAEAPTGGQVIIIQMSAIPLLFVFTLIFFIKGRKS